MDPTGATPQTPGFWGIRQLTLRHRAPPGPLHQTRDVSPAYERFLKLIENL